MILIYEVHSEYIWPIVYMVYEYISNDLPIAWPAHLALLKLRQLCQKRDSTVDLSQWVFPKFSGQFLYKTSPGDCFLPALCIEVSYIAYSLVTNCGGELFPTLLNWRGRVASKMDRWGFWNSFWVLSTIAVYKFLS